MKFKSLMCATLALLTSALLADQTEETKEHTHRVPPEGWSFDISGVYTWISFSTPPTYSGSTGGVQGALTYQKSSEFFGQARTMYLSGSLSSSLNKTHYTEWYSEFVAGYCIPLVKSWTLTPYAGLGLDYIHDNHAATASLASIQLRYHLYYAIAGLDTRYVWSNWMVSLQAECLPMFDSFLEIKALSDAAWTLHKKVGAAVRASVAYRYIRNCWIQLTPYYRYMPIGSSDVLSLPSRNINQWGALVTFRFYL